MAEKEKKKPPGPKPPTSGPSHFSSSPLPLFSLLRTSTTFPAWRLWLPPPPTTPLPSTLVGPSSLLQTLAAPLSPSSLAAATFPSAPSSPPRFPLFFHPPLNTGVHPHVAPPLRCRRRRSEEPRSYASTSSSSSPKESGRSHRNQTCSSASSPRPATPAAAIRRLQSPSCMNNNPEPLPVSLRFHPLVFTCRFLAGDAAAVLNLVLSTIAAIDEARARTVGALLAHFTSPPLLLAPCTHTHAITPPHLSPIRFRRSSPTSFSRPSSCS